MGSSSMSMGGGQQQMGRNGPVACVPSTGRPAMRRGVGGGSGGLANPVANPSEGAQIIGCELYQKLQTFLVSYLMRLLKVSARFMSVWVSYHAFFSSLCRLKSGTELMDEELLRFFTKKWQEYQFSSKVLNGFCAYLNRHWVKRENDSGHSNVYEIYNVCLLCLLFISIGLITLIKWSFINHRV